MSTRDLLKRQDRVFNKKKREFGLPSVLISIASVLVLLPVYASYTGVVVRISWVMALVALIMAVVVPTILARRMRSRGPRLFALVNVLAAVLLFTLLGRSTDGVLASHGERPFESLAALMGAEEPESHPVSGAGRGFIGLLRALTVTGGSPEAGEDPEEAAPEEPVVPDEEPRAQAIPPPQELETAEGSESLEAGAVDPVEERAIQAHVVSASETKPSESGTSLPAPGSGRSGGTYNVVSQPRSTVEVPIQRDGRTFTVGVLIDGRVPADFVFDTGADFTSITPALARRLGLDPDKLEDIRPFQTAGGLVRDPVVRIGRLSIDHAEVRDVEVMVCRRCSSNLLGRNFHGRFRVEIDSSEGLLRLHSR